MAGVITDKPTHGQCLYDGECFMGCNEFYPSETNDRICALCEHYRSFHTPLEPHRDTYGACNYRKGCPRGCLEFLEVATASGPPSCEACGHAKGFHMRPSKDSLVQVGLVSPTGLAQRSTFTLPHAMVAAQYAPVHVASHHHQQQHHQAYAASTQVMPADAIDKGTPERQRPLTMSEHVLLHQAVIFPRSPTEWHRLVNEAAQRIVVNPPGGFLKTRKDGMIDKGELRRLAEKEVRENHFFFKRGKSRAKDAMHEMPQASLPSSVVDVNGADGRKRKVVSTVRRHAEMDAVRNLIEANRARHAALLAELRLARSRNDPDMSVKKQAEMEECLRENLQLQMRLQQLNHAEERSQRAKQRRTRKRDEHRHSGQDVGMSEEDVSEHAIDAAAHHHHGLEQHEQHHVHHHDQASGAALSLGMQPQMHDLVHQ
eukprot:jgi/Chlat1/2399/Chrsp17S02656